MLLMAAHWFKEFLGHNTRDYIFGSVPTIHSSSPNKYKFMENVIVVFDGGYLEPSTKDTTHIPETTKESAERLFHHHLVQSQ